ncbi:MAG: DUF1835 domain-containing protein [Desulfobulbaceae bacterium]|nr:DUF1835 domain-containing protein [Desulfobulbaceae bacterium]
MKNTLHITSGDCAGEILGKSGIAGDVFVWHDILYDGPRNVGWPTDDTLKDRALFLKQTTAGGLSREYILDTLRNQYQKITDAAEYEHIVLWFDACLFDQSMLAHILCCLHDRKISPVELICVDSFPGIVPFNGLGQLQPLQMASLHDQRRPVTDAQFQFAKIVDQAFATQDRTLLMQLSSETDAPLPWIPAAVKRWLQELPDPATGLGKLERLALDAIRNGCEKPGDIFTAVAAADTPPQYWGDITLWAKINSLAERQPPLVKIQGPASRLPQWQGGPELKDFRLIIP